MSRPERLLLLGFFAAVVAALALRELRATAVGAVAGAALGLLAVPRLGRLRGRIDARMGADPRPTGLRPRRVGLRAAAHLVVLGGLLVSTVLIPFVGDELFAASAAAATALPFVLTAARLRR